MQVEVMYREPDTYPAIHWNGHNSADVQAWLDRNLRLSGDYDNQYCVRNNVLYLGMYTLPVNTWLVADGSVQDFTEREFASIFLVVS
jgi:hypothetical protein